MAWCRQATCHYLSQCWPRSVLPYGITRPQWVNTLQSSKNGSHYADEILKYIFLNENYHTPGINLVVHTAQFAHDNPKLRRNRRVGGNFLGSMLPAENAQLFDQWCHIQNVTRKFRNSVFSKHLPPLSTWPFPVTYAQYEFSKKHYICLLRALWMTVTALEHAQRVSRQ